MTHLEGAVLGILVVEPKLVSDPVPSPSVRVLHPEDQQTVDSIDNLVPDWTGASQVGSSTRERMVLVFTPSVTDVCIPRIPESRFNRFALLDVCVEVWV